MNNIQRKIVQVIVMTSLTGLQSVHAATEYKCPANPQIQNISQNVFTYIGNLEGGSNPSLTFKEYATARYNTIHAFESVEVHPNYHDRENARKRPAIICNYQTTRPKVYIKAIIPGILFVEKACKINNSQTGKCLTIHHSV